MMLVALLAGAIAFAADYQAVYRSGKPVVKLASGALLLLGTVMLTLYAMNVNVPSPSKPITEFVVNFMNLR